MNWKDIYTSPLTTVYDASLKTSQYKFLNIIIPTNKYLYRCKIKEYRNNRTLILECATVQNLWNQLENFIKTKVTSFTSFTSVYINEIL